MTEEEIRASVPIASAVSKAVAELNELLTAASRVGLRVDIEPEQTDAGGIGDPMRRYTRISVQIMKYMN